MDENIRKLIDKLFGIENCLTEVSPGNIPQPPKYDKIKGTYSTRWYLAYI